MLIKIFLIYALKIKKISSIVKPPTKPLTIESISNQLSLNLIVSKAKIKCCLKKYLNYQKDFWQQ